jgi:hypothetical protein
MPIECRVVDEQLVISDSTGRTLWEGRVDGFDVVDAGRLGDGCVARLRSDAKAGWFQNLVRISADGSVIWRAQMPTNSSGEAYVQMRVEGEDLVAWSFTGLMVHLDPETGRIRSREFVG